MLLVNKPLSLEGAYNVRELGGYQTIGGQHTRNGLYLRGDGTNALTKHDLTLLNDMGVSLVIDLRSPDEVKQYPSRFYDYKGVQYENVIMFDGMSAMFLNAMPKSMAELYCRLLDNCREQYAQIFKLFYENQGVSLFHCTAGKDRTGVVAMLLLQLAGVPDDMIVADYAVSEHNLDSLIKQHRKQLHENGIELPDYMFGSREQDMEQTLQHLEKNYGGAEKYLKLCGIDNREIYSLKERFVG